MKRRFHQIISDGTLVDNRIHRANDGLLTLGYGNRPIEICDERHPRTAWWLLQNWAYEVNHAIRLRTGALVFLSNQQEYEHNTEDAFFDLQGSDAFNFTLTTGNLIGCLNKDGYTLRISSRFGNEFLKYIVSDADGFLELPEHGGETSGDYGWLLIYFWLVKLKKALRLGLPKSYESRTETLPRVRGQLDAVNYFLNKDFGRYRCTYREHRYDNDATRLIAYTLRSLDSHPILRGTHTISQMFQVATHGEKSLIQQLLATKQISNPYYADYNPVIDASKQILRNQYSDFGENSEKNAFLFDVSMLFEYFIRKLLKRKNLHFHGKSDLNLNIPCGTLNGDRRRKLIPDLVFEVDGQTYVFDVKYKSFDFRYGVNREDLFQLHAYAGQIANSSHLAGCGLIYPIRESRWNVEGLEKSLGIISDVFHLVGHPVPFHVAFLKVPEQGEMSDSEWPKCFQASFQENCEQFVGHLLKTLRRSAQSKLKAA